MKYCYIIFLTKYNYCFLRIRIIYDLMLTIEKITYHSKRRRPIMLNHLGIYKIIALNLYSIFSFFIPSRQYIQQKVFGLLFCMKYNFEENTHTCPVSRPVSPSGWRDRVPRARTKRYKCSFIPSAICAINLHCP